MLSVLVIAWFDLYFYVISQHANNFMKKSTTFTWIKRIALQNLINVFVYKIYLSTIMYMPLGLYHHQHHLVMHDQNTKLLLKTQAGRIQEKKLLPNRLWFTYPVQLV